MSVIKLGDSFIKRGVTVIDNDFISNYLPYAPDNSVKIYLYGLLSGAKTSGGTIENIALDLGIDAQEVVASYEYWQDLGLVRINNTQPFEVEYLPINAGNYKVKKYKPEKYAQFTASLQELFVEQPLTPNNFLAFIEVVEECKIKPDAMLMIAHYCVNLKGNKIHINYILTVARAWAKEGILTPLQVDEKLRELEINSEKMREVFYALKLKKAPDLDDKQTYLKWVNSWGYDHDSILYAAKLVKTGGMKRLDTLLDALYRKGIFTLSGIKEHKNYMDTARNTAIAVLRNIGVYYENTEPVIDVYISAWLTKGFDATAIVALSKYCFKRGVKSLEGMAAFVDKFYMMGIVTLEDINAYIDKSIALDHQIKSLLEILGTARRVTDSDRKFYDTWTNIWNFDIEIIRIACTMAANKTNPFAFINTVLSNWLKSGVDTIAKAEAMAASAPKTSPSKNNADFNNQRDYSKEELDGIFGDTTDVDLFLDKLK